MSDYDMTKVAYEAAKAAAFNLETIVNLLDGQDTLKVSGPSLAGLLRPVLSDSYVAYEELESMHKAVAPQ
jgi:hypothetical protein